jgi:hypothetical protein
MNVSVGHLYHKVIENREISVMLKYVLFHVPYFPIKRSKFIKNEHARYTVEYFPVDNARIIYTKGLNS